MSSLTNKKISNTYKGLLKTADETILSETPKAITDGDGNSSGVLLDTNGNLKVNNTVEFGSLKDAGEDITIEKFVDEADGIENNDNDTSLPTSAAVKNYVDQTITAEDLDFSGNTGTGDVDLDSEVFEITGSNGITTTALDNTLDIDGSTLQTAINTNAADIVTNASNIATNTSNISVNAANIITNEEAISENTGEIANNAAAISNNTSSLSTLGQSVAANTTNIATNANDIDNNFALINTNDEEVRDLIDAKTCGITITKTSSDLCPKDFEFQTVDYQGNPANLFTMKQNGVLTVPNRIETQDIHTGDARITGDLHHRGAVADLAANPFDNPTSGVTVGANQVITNGSQNSMTIGRYGRLDNSDQALQVGINNTSTESNNSLAVGDDNTISQSISSVAMGYQNELTEADFSLVLGQANIIDGSNLALAEKSRSAAIGFFNEINGFSSLAAGGTNVINTEQNGFAIGFNNDISGKDNVFAFGESNVVTDTNANGCFMIGGNLNGADEVVSLGFRNDVTKRPTPDPDNGLAKTRFEIGVGRVDDHTAMVITEGGYNAGAPPQVAQVARIIFPTVVEFDFADDTAAAAGGIPVGGLYHNSGDLKIRLT